MSKQTTNAHHQRILNVLIYIQNNLDGDLSLEKLAEIAHFSPHHFHRIFTAHTGESVKSYIRRLRLARSLQDLALTDKTLIHIAERAGYDTQQSFHRAFKEAYQQTPNDFRLKSKADMQALLDKTNAKNSPTSIPFATKYQVEIRDIPPEKVAFIRQTGSYEQSVQTWLKLTTLVGMEYILSPEIKKIGIPHDSEDQTAPDKIRYDACVSLNDTIKPAGELGIQTIHGGKHAVITHHGSLSKIQDTYRYLFGIWLPSSGYEPDDYPNFMLHRNIPFVTPDDALITEIYLPIKPA